MRENEREERKHVISKILSTAVHVEWPKSDKNQMRTNFWFGVATTLAVATTSTSTRVLSPC
jgi:hypothetical protein